MNKNINYNSRCTFKALISNYKSLVKTNLKESKDM